MPPNWWDIELSVWIKGLNRVSMAFLSIPIPVSWMEKWNFIPESTSFESTVISIWPECVNFKALFTKFEITCLTLSRSPMAFFCSSLVVLKFKIMPFSFAMGSNQFFVFWIMSNKLKDRLSISILFASIFEKSKISLITVNNDCELFTATSTLCCCVSDNSVLFNKFSMPIMPLIGVRISWLIIAKNSLLAFEDFSANSFWLICCACAVIIDCLALKLCNIWAQLIKRGSSDWISGVSKICSVLPKITMANTLFCSMIGVIKKCWILRVDWLSIIEIVWEQLFRVTLVIKFWIFSSFRIGLCISL